MIYDLIYMSDKHGVCKVCSCRSLLVVHRNIPESFHSVLTPRLLQLGWTKTNFARKITRVIKGTAVIRIHEQTPLMKVLLQVFENNHTTSKDYCGWTPRIVRGYTLEGDTVLIFIYYSAKRADRKCIGCERCTVGTANGADRNQHDRIVMETIDAKGAASILPADPSLHHLPCVNDDVVVRGEVRAA